MMSSARPTGTSTGEPGVSNYVLLRQEAAFLTFSGKMIQEQYKGYQWTQRS